jgi:hypothetical protein
VDRYPQKAQTNNNMKRKQYILILILSALYSFSFGQESRVGLKGGLNLSFMSVEDADDNNIIPGFHAGVFGKLMLSESFGIQPEILYSMKGVKTTYSNILAEGETKLNVNYIDIPIYLVYHLARDFDFHLGPYIGFVMNSKIDTQTEILSFIQVNNEDEIDRDNFNTLDYGISGGLGFHLNALTFGFNYNLGLNQAAKENKPIERLLGNAKNNVIQVYVGFSF